MSRKSSQVDPVVDEVTTAADESENLVENLDNPANDELENVPEEVPDECPAEESNELPADNAEQEVISDPEVSILEDLPNEVLAKAEESVPAPSKVVTTINGKIVGIPKNSAMYKKLSRLKS